MADDTLIIRETLIQIDEAIGHLREWNAAIESAESYKCSPDGMRTLAATCMLIEAIGEGVKNIEKRTKGLFLNVNCPEIPWKEIMAMRNHIAHGYFQIDADFVYDVVRSDLDSLDGAIKLLLTKL